MIKNVIKIFIASVFFIAGVCSAELTLPAVFSDGMVLQRSQKVPVWGWAEAGSKVTIEFAGQTKKSVTDANGKWKVMLDPMKASFASRTLTVSKTLETKVETLTVSDVLIGEVWLCSGQSNMQFSMKNASHYSQDRKTADLPGIRMFKTERIESLKPLDDCVGAWSVCSPEKVGEFSAVAFLFGCEIQKELNVPVGLLNSSMGGSKIETWSPAESLTKFPTVMAYKKKEDAKASRGVKAAQPWKYYPGKLYNGMIHPLAPYGLRGMIWYQGESNAHSVKDAVIYRDLIENLVVSWRAKWGVEFPVYAVQLPNYKTPKSDKDSWQFLRESVLNFSKEVANVGMVVAIDAGEAGDIHPKDKRPVGYRLAQQALAKTYGHDIISGGPIYKKASVKGKQVTIEFSDIGSGLVAQEGRQLASFTIAGKNRVFVAANAVIVGDTVLVSSPEVKTPVAVRYAWAPHPEGCNLFNAEGFPASPFRTDVWSPFDKK